MTGESQDRPTQRISRFSQAYRDPLPLNGAAHTAFDERAERALKRANGNAETTAPSSPHWQQAAPPDPYVETIEVEFETVQPLPPAPEFAAPNRRRGTSKSSSLDDRFEPVQPPPPDIEAIAAAVAAEMERQAAQAVLPIPAEAKEAAVPANLPAVIQPPRVPLMLKQAAGFARAKVGPAILRSAFWLAHNLRRKEIRRRYGKAVALAHSRVLDRRLEQHFFVPTLKSQRFGPDPKRSILYEGPVPGASFNWALSLVPGDLREYAFVDFRAGRGRAMLLAAKRNFEKIIGYEYDADLYDDLQLNIAQFPRSMMVCRDVQSFRGDRGGISIPEQPCVLYFANAWREELMSGIMNYVAESYRHKPRRMYIILENVDDAVVLPGGNIFHRLELPLGEKLKLRLFSPMDFQVYQSMV